MLYKEKEVIKMGLKQIPTRDLKRVLKESDDNFLMDGDIFDIDREDKEDHEYG